MNSIKADKPAFRPNPKKAVSRLRDGRGNRVKNAVENAPGLVGNHSAAELSGTKRTPAAVNAEEGMRVEIFRRETDV